MISRTVFYAARLKLFSLKLFTPGLSTPTPAVLTLFRSKLSISKLSTSKQVNGDDMTETKYAVLIKNLFQEYYQGNISLAEYREQRNNIIREMDRDFNGITQ